MSILMYMGEHVKKPVSVSILTHHTHKEREIKIKISEIKK